MDLYLIRHGENHRSPEWYDTERKVLNGPLTEKGIDQANRLAMRCKNIRFDRIYSSDLTRAVQTAERIASTQNQKLLIYKAFREIDMGALERESQDQYSEWYASWSLHEEDIHYPDGENGLDVWNRCFQSLEQIVRSKAERVCIVAHGGTIRSILCGALGIPQQKRFYFGAPLENCSMTVLRYMETDRRFYLQVFNDTSHLLS